MLKVAVDYVLKPIIGVIVGQIFLALCRWKGWQPEQVLGELLMTSPSPEAVQVIYWALSLLMAIGVWAFLSRWPKIRLWLFGTKKPTSGPAQNQHADGPDMTIRDLFFILIPMSWTSRDGLLLAKSCGIIWPLGDCVVGGAPSETTSGSRILWETRCDRPQTRSPRPIGSGHNSPICFSVMTRLRAPRLIHHRT
ncbi:hypothetical protein W911_14235 [Hyphomicrobium nitrativorans NL23]|uniref:Uncharacterized protein n=1 Tax=Hyphomicrobium nitrativorans NL23 TaxID=1029756 RepID=V5SIG2_9HYPH|nr:hypothetical protein W911_14235 [Hyphomicrobium nitrativorans NL23]